MPDDKLVPVRRRVIFLPAGGASGRQPGNDPSPQHAAVAVQGRGRPSPVRADILTAIENYRSMSYTADGLEFLETKRIGISTTVGRTGRTR